MADTDSVAWSDGALRSRNGLSMKREIFPVAESVRVSLGVVRFRRTI